MKKKLQKIQEPESNSMLKGSFNLTKWDFSWEARIVEYLNI